MCEDIELTNEMVSAGIEEFFEWVSPYIWVEVAGKDICIEQVFAHVFDAMMDTRGTECTPEQTKEWSVRLANEVSNANPLAAIIK